LPLLSSLVAPPRRVDESGPTRAPVYFIISIARRLVPPLYFQLVLVVFAEVTTYATSSCSNAPVTRCRLTSHAGRRGTTSTCPCARRLPLYRQGHPYRLQSLCIPCRPKCPNAFVLSASPSFGLWPHAQNRAAPRISLSPSPPTAPPVPVCPPSTWDPSPRRLTRLLSIVNCPVAAWR
jgi:hypothetical protein